MFGFGMMELLVVLAIVIVVFGATRLPQIGKGLGEGIRNFRVASKEPTQLPDAASESSRPAEASRSETR
jgi:sec-independent protein translocase protein TatA